MTLKAKLKEYGINMESRKAVSLTGVSAVSFSKWIKTGIRKRKTHVLMMGLKAIQDACEPKAETFEGYVRQTEFSAGTRITLPNGQVFECVKPEPKEARCPDTIDVFAEGRE